MGAEVTSGARPQRNAPNRRLRTFGTRGNDEQCASSAGRARQAVTFTVRAGTTSGARPQQDARDRRLRTFTVRAGTTSSARPQQDARDRRLRTFTGARGDDEGGGALAGRA